MNIIKLVVESVYSNRTDVTVLVEPGEMTVTCLDPERNNPLDWTVSYRLQGDYTKLPAAITSIQEYSTVEEAINLVEQQLADAPGVRSDLRLMELFE